MSNLDSRTPSFLDLLDSLPASPSKAAPTVHPATAPLRCTSHQERKNDLATSEKTRGAKPELAAAPLVDGARVHLGVKQVAARLSVSVATIWRRSTDKPDFPKPIRFSRGTTRWLVTEIEALELSLRAR